MKLPDAGLKVCVNDCDSSAHAQEGEDNQDNDDETDDIDDTIHGMFLVNGAMTAFHENGTITHHGANSDAKEQVPSTTLLVQDKTVRVRPWRRMAAASQAMAALNEARECLAVAGQALERMVLESVIQPWRIQLVRIGLVQSLGPAAMTKRVSCIPLWKSKSATR